MVGKSGSGKSSTGNTILGEDMFPVGTGLAAVTKTCEHRACNKKNMRIEVVDSPGLFDPERTNKEITDQIVRTTALLHPGPHAVLYVVKLDRYTPEEFNTFQRLKNLFDADIVKFTIIVFTGGDNLSKGKDSPNDLLENAGPTFQKVADECGNRILIFNNKDSKKNKEARVKQLLDVTRKLFQQNGETPYRCTVQQTVGDKLEETVTTNVEKLMETDPKLKAFFRAMEDAMRQAKERAESHKNKMEETLKKRDEVEAAEKEKREEADREKRRREEEERREKERQEAEEREKKKKLLEEAKEKAEKEEEERKERARKEEETRRERERREEEKQRKQEELRQQKEMLELEKKKMELEREARKERELMEKQNREREEMERKREEERERRHREEMERMKNDIAAGGQTPWVADVAGGMWKGVKGWFGY